MTDFSEFDPEDLELVEVVEHEEPLTNHSVARRIAVQVLYEVDCAGHNVDMVLETNLNVQEADGTIQNYITALVKGVTRNKSFFDETINQYAPEWPIEQMAIIDRNILRIAIYELLSQLRLPIGVCIDEAVELAKVFGADGSSRFVNGVLGTLVNDIERLRQRFSQAGEESA